MASALLMAGLLVGVGTCKKQPPTEILLEIKNLSADPIDTLKLSVRGYSDAQWMTTNPNPTVTGRDLGTDPFTVLLSPSAAIMAETVYPGEIRIFAQGYANVTTVVGCPDATNPNCAKYLVGGATSVTFKLHVHQDAELDMDTTFPSIDLDQDSFPACGLQGANGTNKDCDCVDDPGKYPNAALIHPFQPDDCNGEDFNCSGWPLNQNCAKACVPGDTTFCTSLPQAKYNLAGIGACTLGVLACDANGVWQPTSGCPGAGTDSPEIADGIDNDCNGAVDDGLPCDPVATPSRPCFLGQIDFSSVQFPYPRPGIGPWDVCKAGTQSCILANGSYVWSSNCDNEVRPQLNTAAGFGWREMAAGDKKYSGTDQCDGYDNDCNGLYDDGNHRFDNDGDGYTLCGTTYTADNITGKNTFTVGGVFEEYLDCDENNALVHPGAKEICGNTIDEDCVCDEDPNGIAKGQPNSVIGLPVKTLTGTSRCKSATFDGTYLDCTRQPRSDGGCAEPCSAQGASPPAFCPVPAPYYYNYDGQTGNCMYCAGNFGGVCDSVGACTTQATACVDPQVCSESATAASVRPKCEKGNGGCVGAATWSWVKQNGSDIFHDCPTATACVCDGNDVCKKAGDGSGCKANGVSCTANSECASTNCECGDAACTAGVRICSALPCPCQISNGTSCTGSLTNGTTPPACSGANSYCCGGACAGGAGGAWNSACGSGDCAGNWSCSGTAAVCSKYTLPCASCNVDLAYNSTCSDLQGTTCTTATATQCPACLTCVKSGTNASCTQNYGDGTQDSNGTGQCNGSGAYCCGGACVSATNGYGNPCAGADSVGQCAGGHNVCFGQNAGCSTSTMPCGYCSGDQQYNGTCSNNGVCPMQTACAVCTNCQTTSGNSTTCTNVSSPNPDNTAPGICNGPAGCNTNNCACDGNKNCRGVNNSGACTAGTDCLSGNCVGPAGAKICCAAGQVNGGGSCQASCSGYGYNCGGTCVANCNTSCGGEVGCAGTSTCVATCAVGNCAGTGYACGSSNTCVSAANCGSNCGGDAACGITGTCVGNCGTNCSGDYLCSASNTCVATCLGANCAATGYGCGITDTCVNAAGCNSSCSGDIGCGTTGTCVGNCATSCSGTYDCNGSNTCVNSCTVGNCAGTGYKCALSDTCVDAAGCNASCGSDFGCAASGSCVASCNTSCGSLYGCSFTNTCVANCTTGTCSGAGTVCDTGANTGNCVSATTSGQCAPACGAGSAKYCSTQPTNPACCATLPGCGDAACIAP